MKSEENAAIGYEFLAVDGDANSALFWEMTLNQSFEKCKVVTTSAGYDALEILNSRKKKFDLILCSWELQGLSGYILMQKVRENLKQRHVPFVLFSNVLDAESSSLVKEFGINHIFVKPFTKDQIIEKIKAIIEMEKSLDTNQKLVRKVQEYLDEGKPTEALKFCPELCKIKVGNLYKESLCLQGEIWLRLEKFSQSETVFKEALKINPDDSVALTCMAKLMLKTGREAEGLQTLEMLQKKSPKSLTKMLVLGDAYMGQGLVEKAESLYKSMHKLDQENGDARAGLGKVAFSRGQLQVAAKLFKESGMGESMARWLNGLGIAKVKAGRFDEAIEIYRNAVIVLPNEEKLKLIDYNIGLAFYKSNRLNEAIQSFAAALEKDNTYEKGRTALISAIKEAVQKKIALPNESRLKFLLGNDYP